MNELEETLLRWLSEDETIAMATVVHVDGSAPRGEGAKMIVGRSGRVAGSVSGGCVEGAVAEEAQGVFETGLPKLVRYGINKSMMWDVGLSCGGAIDVFIEALDRERVPEFDPGVVQCTVVRGPDRVGARIAIRAAQPRPAGPKGLLAVGALDEEVEALARAAAHSGVAQTHAIGDYQVFVDPQVAKSQLLIVGAVHIAAALCAFADRSGFAVTVLDPRERLNNRERFPDAARLVVGWPEDELPKLTIDENTFVAILTHDEKFDDPTLDFILRRSVRYVGAIGSKKTQEARRRRLIETGISIESIDRLHAPIGLDIGAQSPEEIAIAILSEMIATKHGHRGARLKDREEPRIHT